MKTNSAANPGALPCAPFSFILRVAAAMALWALPTTARGQIFETNINGGGTNGNLGKYSTAGATINASLISGLELPVAVAVSGADLFVATAGANGKIGKYTTSGAPVNAALITGLTGLTDMAVSGTNLFVVTDDGTVGKYTTSGATVNPALISGLTDPTAIAVSGSNLFVAYNPDSGTIGKYTTSGATVNAALISGLSGPQDIAVVGTNLFVLDLDLNAFVGSVGKYSINGATINPSLITGFTASVAMAVSGTELYVGEISTIGKYTTAGGTVNATLISGLNGPSAIALPPCTPPPADMVSWWPGEDDANDIQGSNNGVTQNGTTFAGGEVGQAFAFDGVNAVVQVPNNSAWDFGANAFTIDTWVNFTSISGNDVFVAHDEGSGALNKWIFRLANGHLQLHYNGSAVANVTSSVTFMPAPGQWYHVAVTRSSSTYKFYVNGVQNGANQSDSNSVPAANAPLTIGKAEAIPSLNGRLDEVEIFHRALRISEIADIYNAGSSGKCKPDCVQPPLEMAGWWPANGNTSDVQSGNNGTLKGAATFAPGRVKQGFSLAGGSDFVYVGDPAQLDLAGSITIDAWIKPDDFAEGGVRAIVTKWGQDPSTCGAATSDSYALLLRKQNGVINLRGLIHQPTDGGTEPSLLGGNITPGVFSHVAMTYNANLEAFVIYVNGVPVANAAVPTSGLCTSNKNVLFGSEDSNLGPGRRFSGVIDEVEIFRRALAATEIAAIYNAGSTGKCKSALKLTSAVSRKTHGGAGTFNVNLPLTGQPGVECRSSGGNHKIVFTFSNNIVSGSASVTTGVGSISGSPTFSGKTITVNLTGVADVQKITLTLSNVTDGFAQVLPSAPVSLIMLIGDTTGNKTVNSSDVSQTKAQSGLAASIANFRQDVTVSGVINSSDVALVKSRSGFGVP